MDAPRLTYNLQSRCLALDKSDRAALVDLLTQSLIREEVQAAFLARLDDLVQGMNELAGVDIRTHSRSPQHVRARTVFTHVAKEEGFTQVDIAACLGYNHASVHYMQERMEEGFTQVDIATCLGYNHASVHYMQERMVEALGAPNIWKDYVELYKQYIYGKKSNID